MLKTDLPGFAKDEKTGLLVNVDVSKFDTIKEQRKRYKEQRTLETRIAELEKTVQWLLERVR